jgi:hypothetical protein
MFLNLVYSEGFHRTRHISKTVSLGRYVCMALIRYESVSSLRSLPYAAVSSATITLCDEMINMLWHADPLPSNRRHYGGRCWGSAMWTRLPGNERTRNNGRDVFCASRAWFIKWGLIVQLLAFRTEARKREPSARVCSWAALFPGV